MTRAQRVSRGTALLRGVLRDVEQRPKQGETMLVVDALREAVQACEKVVEYLRQNERLYPDPTCVLCETGEEPGHEH